MRLFVSYARVDKPYCVQIVVETLNRHDVWYDQRLYAGQPWWSEILRRLDWCEGFVYLLSPDSVASVPCRKEFELAQKLGRSIFPVLIQNGVTLPPSLEGLQYADFTKGITPKGIKSLLDSIHQAELEANHRAPPGSADITSDDIRPPFPIPGDPTRVVGAAAASMEKEQFDQAVFLLRYAKAHNLRSQYVDQDEMLKEAEDALKRQTEQRVMEREYRLIAELVKYKRTRRAACKAFRKFRHAYPTYDPDNLAEICTETVPPLSALIARRLLSRPFSLPDLEWCEVPAGKTWVEVGAGQQHVFVDTFEIGKYPITNAQYQVFLNDAEGYANAAWWQFSPCAHAWHLEHPEPLPAKYPDDKYPRGMVNWYDAMAFCRWLSARLDRQVALPTENHWQRAARGDDQRAYPWGNKFDEKRCNTQEAGIKGPTPVTRYSRGVSPYGVYDMAGNVWEWCLNTKDDQGNTPEITSNGGRAVHGGCFLGPAPRAKITFRYYLNPAIAYASIGFRIVRNP